MPGFTAERKDTAVLGYCDLFSFVKLVLDKAGLNPTRATLANYFKYPPRAMVLPAPPDALTPIRVGGEPWNKWNKAMQTAIVDTQRKDTDFCMYKGSWDPLDPWAEDGGRVYSTAALAMCLEVYYRYPRVALTNLGDK